MKKEKELTAEQKKRIETAWEAVLKINRRADKRLGQSEAMGEMLVFCRRWIQPVVMDLSVGRIIVLEGCHRDEDTRRALDAEVMRLFSEQGREQIDFRFFLVADDNAEMVMVYACEHPHMWTWREADREICRQIYESSRSLRSLDVLVDDIERACRTELELIRHDHPEAVREVRLFTPAERKERVGKIKSLTAEYWFEGSHRPGRYPQLSAEDEDARADFRRSIEVLDQRHLVEDRRRRIVKAWENYSKQVQAGRPRDARVEGVVVREALEVAPDRVEEIRTQIAKWDRGK